MLSKELKKELRKKKKELARTSDERERFNHVIKKGDIDARINWISDENLLQKACYKNDINLVKLLLENGADPNIGGFYCSTPLIIAAEKGYIEIVNLLIEYGADVNKRHYTSYSSYSALERTFLSDSISTQVIRALINAGADTTEIKKESYFYLTKAVQNKDIELIKLLIEVGIDINAVDKDDWSILTYMITNDIDNLEIYDFILKNGMDPNIKDKDGKTAIIYAAENGKLDILRRLINTVARTNICDNEQKGMLCHAVINKHFEIVKYLIENKIELCIEDKSKTLILTDNKDLARYLISNGVNINAQDNDLTTSLFNAIERNDIDFVKFLLEYTDTIKPVEGINPYGANPNIQDANGLTPLMLAVIKGHKEIFKILLEHGADVNIKDKKGYTVSDYGMMYDRQTEEMKTEIELAAQVLKRNYDIKRSFKC